MGGKRQDRRGKRDDEIDGDVRAAIERVLSHAESHGEAYEGATDDHTLLRAALQIDELPADRRGLEVPSDTDPETGADAGGGDATGANAPE